MNFFINMIKFILIHLNLYYYHTDKEIFKKFLRNSKIGYEIKKINMKDIDNSYLLGNPIF